MVFNRVSVGLFVMDYLLAIRSHICGVNVTPPGSTCKTYDFSGHIYENLSTPNRSSTSTAITSTMSSTSISTTTSQTQSNFEWWQIFLCAAGGTLILLQILMIVLFVRRRRRRKYKGLELIILFLYLK